MVDIAEPIFGPIGGKIVDAFAYLQGHGRLEHITTFDRNDLHK